MRSSEPGQGVEDVANDFGVGHAGFAHDPIASGGL
jgi:hypothetical protein